MFPTIVILIVFCCDAHLYFSNFTGLFYFNHDLFTFFLHPRVKPGAISKKIFDLSPSASGGGHEVLFYYPPDLIRIFNQLLQIRIVLFFQTTLKLPQLRNMFIQNIQYIFSVLHKNGYPH